MTYIDRYTPLEWSYIILINMSTANVMCKTIKDVNKVANGKVDHKLSLVV
jgi:hypothetical protein